MGYQHQAGITILVYLSIIGLIGIVVYSDHPEQGSHLANIDYNAIGSASLKAPLSYINTKLQSWGLITSI